MDDKELDLVCQDCGKAYTFTQDDAQYFARRGWPAPPRACRACRAQSKRRDAPNAPKPQPDAQPTYATGDPNEYRSPMDCAYPTPPRIQGVRRPQPVTAEGEVEDEDVWARDPNSIGDPNGYRSPMQGGDPVRVGRRFGRRNDRGNEVRAHAYRRQVVGDASEYRSPMGGQHAGQSVARSHGGSEGQPRDGRAVPQGRTQGSDRRRSPPRTMHTAVCAKCGVEAQVPFEPTAGRDVFCKACFAERRNAAPEETAGEG